MLQKNVIVLGGAGYIGSHACRALEKSGFSPVVVDDFSLGHEALCAGRRFEKLDILQTAALAGLFTEYRPLAVIHFAARTNIGESVKKPDLYRKINLEGTRSVLKAMQDAGVKNLVFSSTAAVYGQPQDFGPIAETRLPAPINPYGESKAAAEALIQSYSKAGGIRSVSLRYFNAAGADEAGDLGEAHFPETHLIPLVMQAVLGLRANVAVYGRNYDTKDGTCIRDYVHVTDLAEAHVIALEYLLQGGDTDVFNLGSGAGQSVQEIIELAAPYAQGGLRVTDEAPRPGDPAFLVADTAKAKNVFGWVPRLDLGGIIRTAYNWHNSATYQQLYKKHGGR